MHTARVQTTMLSRAMTSPERFARFWTRVATWITSSSEVLHRVSVCGSRVTVHLALQVSGSAELEELETSSPAGFAR